MCSPRSTPSGVRRPIEPRRARASTPHVGRHRPRTLGEHRHPPADEDSRRLAGLGGGDAVGEAPDELLQAGSSSTMLEPLEAQLLDGPMSPLYSSLNAWKTLTSSSMSDSSMSLPPGMPRVLEIMSILFCTRL